MGTLGGQDLGLFVSLVAFRFQGTFVGVADSGARLANPIQEPTCGTARTTVAPPQQPCQALSNPSLRCKRNYVRLPQDDLDEALGTQLRNRFTPRPQHLSKLRDPCKEQVKGLGFFLEGFL